MKAPKPIEKNTFFDINKFPQEKGLLVFPISMARISNRQNAENCLSDILTINSTKISKPTLGVNFVYGDFLYLYSDEKASELKNKYMHEIINHKNATQKILDKNSKDLQIQHAFNFLTWNQLYLGAKDFTFYLRELKKVYQEDEKFQKYVQDDCATFQKEISDNQINFFLEESLMFYFISHGKIILSNNYIENNQKWVLNCYPGKPMKSIVYVGKLNPFKLDWPENPYQDAFYDLESKQLIRYNDVDLETYSVK